MRRSWESGLTFEVVGEIETIETIAAGPSVNVRSLLRKMYGRGRWRKLKGIGRVRLPNGNIRRVERSRSRSEDRRVSVQQRRDPHDTGMRSVCARPPPESSG